MNDELAWLIESGNIATGSSDRNWNGFYFACCGWVDFESVVCLAGCVCACHIKTVVGESCFFVDSSRASFFVRILWAVVGPKRANMHGVEFIFTFMWRKRVVSQRIYLCVQISRELFKQNIATLRVSKARTVVGASAQWQFCSTYEVEDVFWENKQHILIHYLGIQGVVSGFIPDCSEQ